MADSGHDAHARVLKSVGIQRQAAGTQTEVCGICRGCLSIYTRPEGGTWLYCMDCGFAGSSLHYIERVRGVDDAAQALKAKGFSEQDITSARAAESADAFTLLAELWSVARSRVKTPTLAAAGASLLQARHLFTSSTLMLPWVGYTTSADIRQLQASAPKTYALRGSEAYKTFLCVPRYDIPGRICGLSLLHSVGQAELVIERKEGEYCPGYGLALLSTTDGCAGDVYAVDDLFTALAVQRQHFLVYGAYASMVEFGDGARQVSKSTWEYVGARPVTVVARHGIVQGLAATRAVAMGELAHFPSFPARATDGDVLRTLAACKAASVLPLAKASAESWESAARRWIFSDPANMPARVAQVAPSRDLLARLERGALEPEIAAIRASTATGVRDAVLDDIRIRRRDSGYWALTKEGESQIADFLLGVSELHTTPDGVTTIATCVLSRGDFQVTAHVECKTLETPKLAAQWLLVQFVAAGQPPPQLDTRWRGKLLGLGLLFSTPRTCTMPHTLGWDAGAKAFVLPRFTAGVNGCGAVANVAGRGAYGGGLSWDPACAEDDMRCFVASETTNAVGECVFALITVVNLVAAARGLGCRALAAGCAGGDRASLFEIGRGLDIDVVRDETLARKYMAGQRTYRAQVKGLTAVLDVGGAPLTVRAAVPAIVACTPFAATAAAIHPGWFRYLHRPLAGRISYTAAAAALAAKTLARLARDTAQGASVYADVVEAAADEARAYGSDAVVYAAAGAMRDGHVADAIRGARYAVLVDAAAQDGTLGPARPAAAGARLELGVSELTRVFALLGAAHPPMVDTFTILHAAGCEPAYVRRGISVSRNAWSELVAQKGPTTSTEGPSAPSAPRTP